jgi:hypothetical protein
LSARTLRALPFTTVSPMVTWPSPPMATRPSLRTARTVVERTERLTGSALAGAWLRNGGPGRRRGVNLTVTLPIWQAVRNRCARPGPAVRRCRRRPPTPSAGARPGTPSGAAPCSCACRSRVVESETCPSSSFTASRSAPASSRWVANVWRSAWAERPRAPAAASKHFRTASWIEPPGEPAAPRVDQQRPGGPVRDLGPAERRSARGPGSPPPSAARSAPSFPFRARAPAPRARRRSPRRARAARRAAFRSRRGARGSRGCACRPACSWRPRARRSRRRRARPLPERWPGRRFSSLGARTARPGSWSVRPSRCRKRKNVLAAASLRAAVRLDRPRRPHQPRKPRRARRSTSRSPTPRRAAEVLVEEPRRSSRSLAYAFTVFGESWRSSARCFRKSATSAPRERGDRPPRLGAWPMCARPRAAHGATPRAPTGLARRPPRCRARRIQARKSAARARPAARASAACPSPACRADPPAPSSSSSAGSGRARASRR